MSFSSIDTHLAASTMRLKNVNHCLSFVSTVWKGEFIMCVFNNLQKEIATVYCNYEFEPDEFQELERIVYEFIFDQVLDIQ